MSDVQDICSTKKHMLEMAFRELSNYIKFDKPEKVNAIDIKTNGCDGCADLDLKIIAGTQSCYFSFMPAVNSLTDLWHFLEDVIVSTNAPSVYFSDQEGPEAIFYIKKHKDGDITVTVLEEGWYEFDTKNIGCKQVYNKEFSITLNIKCDKKLFVKQMHKVFASYQNGVPKNSYCYNETRYKSDLIAKYLDNKL